MADRNFRQMLEGQWSRGNFVCVGLDSEFSRIPEFAHRAGSEAGVSVANTIVGFNRAIVEATVDLVCAYKPNLAFYLAYGPAGIAALHRTIVDIHTIAPEVPVILDAKFGDIGNTNSGYVDFTFRFLHADAVTVQPYLGGESLQPFLTQVDKGILILCKTSNPGAGEFQDMPVMTDWAPSGVMPFYQYDAMRIAKDWNTNGNCGLVVGATYPDELHHVRRIVGDMPILLPGIGAQGGDVESTVLAGRDNRGRGIIVNSSRGIIFASRGDNFAEAARAETQRLRALIKQLLA